LADAAGEFLLYHVRWEYGVSETEVVMSIQAMEKQPTFFDFAAEVGLTKHKGGVVPENLADYFGYGLFVGQK
jgi:hypothetical protein